MSWVIVGVAAAGAIMGAEKNKKAQEIEDADRKLQGELTRYSWVDGAQQGDPSKIQRAGSMFGDIGQGALSGAMFGQSVNGAMKKPETSWYDKLNEKPTTTQYSFGSDYGNG